MTKSVAAENSGEKFLADVVPDEVLLDWEGPKIFTARSGMTRQRFYGYIAEETDTTEIYVYAPVSEADWMEAKAGKITVEALVRRATGGVVRVMTIGPNGKASVVEIAVADLDPDWLPGPVLLTR